MDDAAGELWKTLDGEHRYDTRAKHGNWVVMWMPPVLSLAVAGGLEAHLRGWTLIRITPFLIGVCAAALVGTAIWVQSFNATHYRVDADSISCTPGWPRRAWRVWRAEVEDVILTQDHGHWILLLRVRSGAGRRRVVLTKSMRERLGLA